MSIIHAIVLGLTQGLTEFLPISSSGHLVLVRWIFGWPDISNNAALAKTFDVSLHAGTLVAVVGYFRADVWRLAKSLPEIISPEKRNSGDSRLAWALLVSAIPGSLLGALFGSVIEEHLSKPVLISIMLIVFGLVLWWADRLQGTRSEAEFGYRDALLLGLAQAVALQPGVSRSGMTMTAGRAVGYTRDATARISFLMSIPIIAGAVAYKSLDLIKDGIPNGMHGAFAAGILSSAISGTVAIAFLLRLIRTRSFAPFVVYRVLFGASLLVLAATNVL